MRSETATTLKNTAGKNRYFLKNGQDLRSWLEQETNNNFCLLKGADVK
jgi:hypothetical protein